MKFICLLFITFTFFTKAYAFEDVVLPQTGYNASKNMQINNIISNDEFCEMEKKVFNKTYQNDNAQKRLARLETEVFGMEQNGENYLQRLETLFTAIEYYQDGYRIAEKQNTENKNYHRYKNSELNSKNYIQNYNFSTQPEYTLAQSDYINPETIYKNQNKYYIDENKEETSDKKKSKIKQFFSNIADILSAGIMTGYTLPMNNYGIDTFNSYTDLAGSSFIGPPTTTYIGPSIYSNYPSYVNIPRMIRPSRYYHNYPRPNYYNRPNYYPRHTNSGYYRPNGIGIKSYGMGSKVRIIK